MAKNRKVNSSSKRTEQKENAEKAHELSGSIGKLQTTPPRHLSRISSRLWTQLVPMLNKTGLVNATDKQTVESYCIAYEMMRNAWDDIKKNGATYTTESGRTYKNPNVDILDNSLQKMKALSMSLGLSPQARANLVDIADDDGSEDFAKIMEQFGGR